MNTLRSNRRFLAGGTGRSLALACVLGAIAPSLTGCTAVLGLEDRELASDGGASASASTSASSSTATTAASSSSTGPADGGIDHDADRDGSVIRGESDATIDGPSATVDAQTTCPATGTCVLASGLNAPWLITSDANNVYWTEAGSSSTSSDGAVKACAVGGCTTPLVYADHQNGARGLAVDTQRVYWDTQSIDTSVSGGGVWSCPLAGCSGAPTKLAAGTQPYGLAVDATYLYWVDEWDESIHRVPKDGSSGDVFLVAANDGNNPIFDPGQVALDANNLYINDMGGGVYRFPLAGSEPVLMYAGMDANDWPLAVDSTNVYMGETGNGNGYILRIPKANPANHTKIAQLVKPYGVAVDGPTSPLVYWADFGTGAGDGTVGHVTSLGANPVDLATMLAEPGSVTVNSTYAFWTDLGANDGTQYIAGTGYIARIAK